jgi:glycosyltransferase involved in cell wall biosynthesis
MKYSFIIPALNEEDIIGEAIKSIKKQKGSFEIIVVDNGSKDKTTKIAKDLGCRVIKEKKKGISPARNRGAKEAKGEYLCFVDADGELASNWLQEANNILNKKKVDAIVGLNIFKHENFIKRIWYNTYIFFAYMGIYLSKTLFGRIIFEGNNLVIKRSFLLKIGGFDPVVGEGMWTSKKFRASGGTSVFRPQMIIYYSTRGFEEAGYIKTIIFWITATAAKKDCGEYSYKNKNWKK